MLKKSKKAAVVVLVVLFGLGLMLAGCTPAAEPEGTPGEALESPGEAGESTGKETIKIGYVMWACAEASTHIAQAVVMDYLGYDAEAIALEVGGMYSGIADGDLDFQTTAWLPVTHKEYMDTFGDQVVDYGILYEEARIGLVVPSYVDINSIEELNEHADKFGGRITGIDGGAGIMMATEKAIDEYGLELELLESSDMAMTAALADAISEEEWIVVTGWTPHWKFARYDLKFLEDPKKIYGDVETINIIARQGLDEDAPEVARFLENFYLEPEQLGAVIGAIADGEEPLEAARQWIADNEDIVEGWLQ
ncbi:MAG: glycine betaine ABC transporter substrate-binding protein [Firmicutes bacterium]|nr:glycine betaine ABC transporter substrate-binding protein [Bacillota bacterium]